MNIKGHIAVTSIFLIEVERILNKREDFESDVYINSWVNFYNLLPTFYVDTTNSFYYLLYNLIFISLIIFLGSSFPDTDTWWRKKLGFWKEVGKEKLSEEEEYKMKYQFAIYHRQYTHSLFLHILILGYCIFYLGLNYKNYDLILPLEFVKILYYFELGVFTHLIADVFVGSGGIPILLKGHWRNKTTRLSLKLSHNNNYVDNTFIIIYFMLLFCYILLYDTNYYTLLPIVIVSIISFFFTSSYKIFWLIFSIIIFNYLFLFKILNFIN